MAYVPPTLTTLRESVRRDLRDPNNDAFTDLEVKDLINGAVLEVSRVYPKEQVVSIDVTESDQRVFGAVGAYAIFRVEALKDGNVYYGVPGGASEVHSQAGWDYHGGTLYLPDFVGALDPETNTLRVWGYWPRETMDAGTDRLDGDAETEWAVRAVATVSGYQRLQSDRTLFQQWRTNPANTDVSMNQLVQLTDFYQGHWERLRRRIRILQRT
jgi:hypothetical protein